MAHRYILLNLSVFIFCIFHLVRSEEELENHCKDIFDKCECTDYYIYCDDQGLNDITLLRPYIKTTVSSIIVKGNNFKQLPIDLFHACTEELPYLTNLDLSNNKIEKVHETSFQCLDKLEKLSLRNNSILIGPFLEHFYITTTNLKRLNLSAAFNNSDNSLSSKLLTNLLKKSELSTVQRLDLSGNNIQGLYYDAGTALCDLYALKYLNLSHNNLTNPMIRECMANLEVLDLSNNSISRLAPALMDSIDGLLQLKEAYLDNNPYACDCSVQGMVDWLNSTWQPVNKTKIVCIHGDPSVAGLPVSTLTNVSKLECIDPKLPTCIGLPEYVTHLAKTPLVYIFVAGGLFVIVICVVVVALLIRRRRRKAVGRELVKTQDPDDGPPYKRIV